MLTSLALIFILGLFLGSIFMKFKLPRLLGMIIAGIILGPYVLNLLDEKILFISADLRKLALIIILIRAGLSLDIADLKKVGRPAILMSFVPAVFEIAGITILAPYVLGVNRLEAAIIGAVVAAVSPAVIVPRMIRLIEDGRGTKKGIPQLIMASSSVDDVFVIVIFTALVDLASGVDFSAMAFVGVPISIVSGIVAGICVGLVMVMFFKKYHRRDSEKVIILLGVSFLLVWFEEVMDGIVPFSGLIGVMSLGATILFKYKTLSVRLSAKFSKLWVCAEILLFVLVGATVDISYALSEGLNAVLLILVALLFRMVGVFVCLIKTNLNKKERLFCVISYIPKATVQAAIGGVPLAMGLPCGNIVLTVAVLAILITAPMGALLVDKFDKDLLE